MKTYLKVIITILTVSLITAGILIHSFFIAPKNITVRKESFTSSSISETFNGVKIVVFSDLHYGEFVDENRLNSIVDQINFQNPDIVLFLGDLIDHPSTKLPTEETISSLTNALDRIDANLGKYAILGNHDLESNYTKELISDILYNSSFEVITNKSIRIRNGSSDSIVLTGLDSQLLGYPDFETPFESVSADDFSITICHTPDSISLSPTTKIDLFLSGHSHGGQIYIPIIGSIYKPPYAEKYNKGTYKVDDTKLDVTNGVGTTKYDVRFLSNAEIVVYTLKSK